VTAALLIPPIIYVIFQGGLWVLATVVVITLLGVNEFYQLIEAKGAEPLRGVGMLAAVALPVITYLGSDYAATVLMSFVLLGVMVAQLGKAQIAESLASISGTFFGVFYIGWLLSHAVALREFHDVVQGRFGADAAAGLHPDVGAFYLLFTISVVIGGDTGAYFVGRKYGRRSSRRPSAPARPSREPSRGCRASRRLAGRRPDAFRPSLRQLGWLAALFSLCSRVSESSATWSSRSSNVTRRSRTPAPCCRAPAASSTASTRICSGFPSCTICCWPTPSCSDASPSPWSARVRSESAEAPHVSIRRTRSPGSGT
jgi:phosphatidate cytidylyltransferase